MVSVDGFNPLPNPLLPRERGDHCRVLVGRLFAWWVNSSESVLRIGEIWGVDFLV